MKLRQTDQQNPRENPATQKPQVYVVGNLVENAVRIVRGNFDHAALIEQLAAEEENKSTAEKFAEYYDKAFHFVFPKFPDDPKVIRDDPNLAALAAIYGSFEKTAWMERKGDYLSVMYDEEQGKEVHCALFIVPQEDMDKKQYINAPIITIRDTDISEKKGYLIMGIKPVPISQQWAGLALMGAVLIAGSFKIRDLARSVKKQYQCMIRAHEAQSLLLHYTTDFQYLEYITQFINRHAPYEKYMLSSKSRDEALKKLEEISNWSGQPPESKDEEKLRREFHLFTIAKAYAKYRSFVADGAMSADEILMEIMKQDKVGGHLYISY
jgi:hypothetical protein